MIDDPGNPFEFSFSEGEDVLGPSPFVVGDVVDGRYRIDAVLGWGRFGRVYRAMHLEEGRTVALKCFDSANSQLVRQEYARLQSLAHASIPKVYGTFIEAVSSRCCITMEYVEGRSVAALLQEAVRVPPAISAQIISGAADALDYLHGEGFYHRDLKPDNLLVDDEDRCWLIDFGASEHAEDLWTKEGMVDSTPHYAPAEVVTGDPRSTDWTSEVYSLGLVLKELLQGGVEGGASREEAFVRDLIGQSSEPEYPNDVPQRLAEICTRSLQTQRDEAYLTVAEFGDELLSFLAGEGVGAHRDSEFPLAAWRAGRFMGEAKRYGDEAMTTLAMLGDRGEGATPESLIRLVLAGTGLQECMRLVGRYLGRFGVPFEECPAKSGIQQLVYNHGKITSQILKDARMQINALVHQLDLADAAAPDALEASGSYLVLYECRRTVERAVDDRLRLPNLEAIISEAVSADTDYITALRTESDSSALSRVIDQFDRRVERSIRGQLRS